MKKKSETLVLENIIFITLNILFFSGMLFFVYSLKGKSFVYEQVYSKQIALMIDNSKTDSVYLLDVKDILEIAKKNKISDKEIFNIDNKNNIVKIKLNKNSAYGYNFFSDYNVSSELRGNFLYLIINKNGG